jgi:phosphotransferase system HPr-like phosphotransfer protein
MISENIIFPYCVSGRMAHSLVYSINALGGNVYFQKGERTVNAGSIIGLLSLDIKSGEDILVFVNDNNTADGIKILEKVKKIILN